MRFKPGWLSGAVATLFSLGAGASVLPSARAETCAQAVAGVVQDQRRATGAAHAALILEAGGRTLIAQGFGSGVSTQSRFLLASISKSLLAVTSARLIDEGRLSVEDPTEPGLSLPSTWPQFRLRHWLHHTSGVADYVNGNTLPNGTDAATYLKVARTPQEVASVIPKKLLFEPDQNLSYSNTGYWLLAHHLERKFNQPISRLLEERVALPLGLQRTSYVMAVPEGVLGSTTLHIANWKGAGNAVSTAEDLMRLLRALDEDGGFLSSRTREALFTADPECRAAPGTGTDKCSRYGLGFSLRKAAVDRVSGEEWVLHQGHFARTSNVIAKVPARRLNLVLLSDLPDADQEARARAIFSRVMAAGCAPR